MENLHLYKRTNRYYQIVIYIYIYITVPKTKREGSFEELKHRIDLNLSNDKVSDAASKLD